MAENKRRQANPVVSSSLSEAAGQIVLDGLDQIQHLNHLIIRWFRCWI